jgi:acetyltransferase-like isoleucine patch superfamily enzyme
MRSPLSHLRSNLRRIHLQAKYPGIRVDGATTIGSGCRITCTLTGSIRLIRSTIGRFVVIHCAAGGHIEIVDCVIGDGAVIAAVVGITLERTIIGDDAVIRDQDHRFGPGLFLQSSGFVAEPVCIAPFAEIQCGATVLKGVSVGPGAVVQANSVVTRSVLANTVVGGVPAIPITGPQ